MCGKYHVPVDHLILCYDDGFHSTYSLVFSSTYNLDLSIKHRDIVLILKLESSIQINMRDSIKVKETFSVGISNEL